MQVERIRQDNALERLVLRSFASSSMKRFLDMNGRDVIGQQNEFAGVQLLSVFPDQIIASNQPGLQQAYQKDARAGKGVQNVYAFVAQ